MLIIYSRYDNEMLTLVEFYVLCIQLLTTACLMSKNIHFIYNFCNTFRLDNPEVETTETRCRTEATLPGTSGRKSSAGAGYFFSVLLLSLVRIVPLTSILFQ